MSTLTIQLTAPIYSLLGQNPKLVNPKAKTNRVKIPKGTNEVCYQLVRGTRDLYKVIYLGTLATATVRSNVLPMLLAEAHAKGVGCRAVD